MRAFGTFLLIAAVATCLVPWWPTALREPLPPWPRAAWLAIALGLATLGLLLWRRRRPTAAASEAEVQAFLAAEGFRVESDVTGWQAVGNVAGITTVIRRDSGLQAGRFGRAWVLIVAMKGHPRKPWPLPPNTCPLIDEDEDQFSCVVVDANQGAEVVGRRLAEIVASRRD